MSEYDGFANPRLTQAALEYAALCLRVFPLCKKSKVPLIERWPVRATCDEEQVVSWFESWPEANLGIATGGGLVVVDVDPRNGGRRSFRTLLGRRKWPDTAHAMTGSGGDHYLFRVDAKQSIPTITGLRPGIDIKGEGGYIVAEPSVHPATLKEYVWLRTPQQGVAEVPAWLLEILVGHAKPRPGILRPVAKLDLTRGGNGGPLLADAVARFPVTCRGQRNAQMVRLVGSLLGRGYRPELTEAVVTGWWRHYYGLGVVGTPLSEAPREIGACIGSMLRSLTFTRAVGTDHRGAIGRIELSEGQRDMLGGYITPTPPHSNRVTHGHRLCTRRHDRHFIEALVVYFTYKTVQLREHPLKATNDQFRWAIEDRHGIKLDNRQLERLVGRYITRPGRPANHYELAVQTVKGRRAIPSEYELTGLLAFLPPEAIESSIQRPTW